MAFLGKKILSFLKDAPRPLYLSVPLTHVLLLPITQVGYVELKTTSDPPKRELLDLSLLLPPLCGRRPTYFLSSYIIGNHV